MSLSEQMWWLTVWIVYGDLLDIFFNALYFIIDASLHGDGYGNGSEKRWPYY